MTPQQLQSFCPAAAAYYPGLERACALYRIETPRRQAHFLAQIAHESAGFVHLLENLNYSENGLLQTWPSRFTNEKAHELARHPEAIANFVYGGRMGNTAAGDGWRYRGRGLIQLTGRSNYARATADISATDVTFPDLVANPDAAFQPPYAPIIAGWFWNSKALNLLADRDDIVAITRAINGGLTGLSERRQWLTRAKEALE